MARSLDGEVPSGSGGHRSLLDRMVQPGEARPSVLRTETRSALTALLRFRHFLRHAYAVDLDWVKLRPLARSLRSTNDLVAADLSVFRAFVASCLRKLSDEEPGA